MNILNSLNSDKVFYSIQFESLFRAQRINFIKDRANFCKTCMCGDRLKAERVLIWLVHNSFQIHSFINHFFGFGIIVPKNPIQVASCEQALIKTNRKPIQNHQSKTVFLFKRTHLNLSLTDISSTLLVFTECIAIRECTVGFKCLL